MQLRLQKCSPRDSALLAELSRKTFIEAFEKANNPADFKAYLDKAFAEEILRVELHNPNISFYFVLKDDQPVGYLKLNENKAQTDVKINEAIELERIYLLKDFQGQQIGRWMMQEVLKIASLKQKAFIWLGVWEKNKRAIKFYENLGYSKFGTHPYYVGNDKQTDWMMRFDLSSNP